MAATSTLLETSIVLSYKDGLDAQGKEIIKKESFSNVKITAPIQDIYDVAKEIEKLLGKTIDEIVRQDESAITNV
ncbi:DUF1659 domain-containing protein [Clostridium sp. WILCCON 0269]|uniref:DUF1659 domain-containing protein n=1 Tax=Candidatus Clostridium eludens TaxID=3381663 RepID=A0ABW8SEW0_9CLOT